MSYTITGVDEVLAKLDKKFSQSKMTRIEKQALNVAGRYLSSQLRHAVSAYKDTGATVREVTFSTPRRRNGRVSLKVGWKGDGTMGRWRLVHLNEFGYTRNGKIYSPRGLGIVQKTYDANKDIVKQINLRELKRLLK